MTAFRAIVDLTLRGAARPPSDPADRPAGRPAGAGRTARPAGRRAQRRARDPRHALHPNGRPARRLGLRHGAIGSEIEDGTLIFLLVKPVAALADRAGEDRGRGRADGRSRRAADHPDGAAGRAASAPSRSTRLSGSRSLLSPVGRPMPSRSRRSGSSTSPRARSSGSAYTLLWEGVLAGLLEGTRFLSIRQGTLGVAAALTGEDVGVDVLAPVVSVAILVDRRGRRVPAHEPGVDPVPGSLGGLIVRLRPRGPPGDTGR